MGDHQKTDKAEPKPDQKPDATPPAAPEPGYSNVPSTPKPDAPASSR